MRLQRIKCPPFDQARNVTVSLSYVVGCTGRRAVVLDRQYNVVRIVDGLSYVYRAYVSPDETRLLLISNENRFYVAEIASGEMRKVTIRVPFHYNLEGRGCWSHDGKYIYIPVMHAQTLTSTLRRYRADDLTVDKQYPSDGFLIYDVQPMKKSGAFFMFRYDRETMQYSFVHLHDDEFSVYPMEKKTTLFPGCILNGEEVFVPGSDFYGRYTLDGKLIEHICNPFAEKEAVIENPLAELEKLRDELAAKYALPDAETVERPEKPVSAESEPQNSIGMRYEDAVKKYALSECGRYAFMSTNSGFYLMDAASGELLASIPVHFGVQNFEQLEEDVIALATWGGVKLFRMIEE